MYQYLPNVCYYCGIKLQPNTLTKEHVPPKVFFPNTDRDNLITVPSCHLHNSGKSNDDEYVTATIELLSKSKKGKAEIMVMRKAILNKFRYIGLDNVQNVAVVICRLESEQDLHESDEVDEIYRRILEFNILTHK